MVKKSMVKNKWFLDVLEYFWARVNASLVSKKLAQEVERLSDDVRTALIKQLDINYQNKGLHSNVEMGEEALSAMRKLCNYLDKHDKDQDYRCMAGLPKS